MPELRRVARPDLTPICGPEELRQWVDDAAAAPGDLDVLAVADEEAWVEDRRGELLY